MNKYCKLLAVILALCMMAGIFAGCGSKAESNEVCEPIEYNIEFDPDDGPLTPYEDTLTVEQVRYAQPGCTYIRGESKTDNFIRTFYKEKLNIEYKTVWETEYTSYFTKLNLDIGSDTLPDVFLVDGAQLQALIENDQIEDLTPYYRHYASDILKANVEYDNGYLLQFPTVDGKIYGLPRFTSYAGETAFMWLRTDWMEKLGLSAPTTWDEFLDYIRALKDSGLCTNNSSGFSFLGVASESFDAICQMFGAYYDYFIEDEKTGELTYSGVSEEMKTALQAMQDMYNEGLIDADWASKGSTEEEMISSGQYGVVFGRYFYPYLLRGSKLNDRNAEWGCFPVPSYDKSGETHPMGTNYTNGYIVVRKGFEHPEALIKTMNLWCELNVEGGEYTDWLVEQTSGKYKSANLVNEYMLPYAMEGVSSFTDTGAAIREIMASGNPDEEVKNHPFVKTVYEEIKDPNASDWLTGNGWWHNLVYTQGAEVMESYLKRGLQFNEFQGMLTEDSAFNKVTLDKMMVETYTNIIIGESADTFDTFVSDWYDEGGDTILEEANAWYAAK